jgi:hypothetical protein
MRIGMQPSDFQGMVAMASLAPSVHNIQPVRWRLDGSASILIAQDLSVTLPAGDPFGQDVALSVGAAVEATVLALSIQGLRPEVENLWISDDRTAIVGHRIAARLVVTGNAPEDPLAAMLPRRFTHRGTFLPGPVATWESVDATFLTKDADISWIAGLNDQAGLRALRNGPVRAELRHWMRLSSRHPRWGQDGMNRLALRMSPLLAVGAGLALGPLWSVLDTLGLSGAVTAEATKTRTAAVIGCFHRPADEDPITTGRAYLRFCLQAATLGYAQWPMAALTDDPNARRMIIERLVLPPDRRLVQVIRFGRPDTPPPPRARRAVADLILSG